jgi:hypothetical protein
MESLGVELGRVSASHRVFMHHDIPQLINLQSLCGQAKPYQLRQLMRLLERDGLGPRHRPRATTTSMSSTATRTPAT